MNGGISVGPKYICKKHGEQSAMFYAGNIDEPKCIQCAAELPSMTQETNRKPCPFCGCPIAIYAPDRDAIQCQSCGATGPSGPGQIGRWNRRA